MLLPDQTAGSHASVNGLKMYYELHGSGEPLVMLHGGMSTSYIIEIKEQ